MHYELFQCDIGSQLNKCLAVRSARDSVTLTLIDLDQWQIVPGGKATLSVSHEVPFDALEGGHASYVAAVCTASEARSGNQLRS